MDPAPSPLVWRDDGLPQSSLYGRRLFLQRRRPGRDTGGVPGRLRPSRAVRGATGLHGRRTGLRLRPEHRRLAGPMAAGEAAERQAPHLVDRGPSAGSRRGRPDPGPLARARRGRPGAAGSLAGPRQGFPPHRPARLRRRAGPGRHGRGRGSGSLGRRGRRLVPGRLLPRPQPRHVARRRPGRRRFPLGSGRPRRDLHRGRGRTARPARRRASRSPNAPASAANASGSRPRCPVLARRLPVPRPWPSSAAGSPGRHWPAPRGPRAFPSS
jgi:hypothetical protein